MNNTVAADSSVQIKITLPARLQEFVQSKADRFGLSVASYIKHLVLTDAKDMDYPTFKMSKKTEKLLKQALQDDKEGKTIEITDIDEFFDTL